VVEKLTQNRKQEAQLLVRFSRSYSMHHHLNNNTYSSITKRVSQQQ